MVIHLQLVYSIFSFLLLLNISNLTESTSDGYQPKDSHFISFGMSNDDSASSDDPPDPWQSDERFLVTPLPSANNSIALAKAEVSPPFDRARVFRAPTTYSIPVSSPGPKFIRLYLFPPSLTSYDIIDATQSYLSLTINGREILGNFSGYIVTANANANANTTAPASGGLVREIYMTVNKTVNLTFSPSNQGRLMACANRPLAQGLTISRAPNFSRSPVSFGKKYDLLLPSKL